MNKKNKIRFIVAIALYPLLFIAMPLAGYPTFIDFLVCLACPVTAMVLMATAFATGGWRTKAFSLLVGGPPTVFLAQTVWWHFMHPIQ